MKTVDEILSEMRKPKSNCPKDERYEVAYSVADLESVLKNFADRIEAAAKALKADRDNWRRQALDEDARANATCKESLQVGNAAAIYEALKTISKCDISKEEDCYTIYRVCESALSAPPRNCDVMSLADARKVWFLKEIIPRLDGKLPLGKEVPFEEWFVSQLEQEAKGEQK